MFHIDFFYWKAPGNKLEEAKIVNVMWLGVGEDELHGNSEDAS